uniref:Tetratricopeptide repeat protein 14 n=1 Tax=Petromyzon marinus TaxID=7757 RepID=A0AAJ7T9R9_PETMA|nr:tetratricopeptide repeat protein 14 [Petromyzon marinus]XP_032813819.1 tetratricopeptide repeat protein 14 [Petromyzon marinus]
MDQAQLQRCVEHHGPTLLAMLQAEQDENIDVAAITAPEARLSSPPDPLSLRIQHFIAKKADLLFAKGWKSREGSGLTRQDERREYVAVPPPLEQLMCVRSGVARAQFFSDVEPQDLLIGRVTAVKEFGFFVNLVCFDCGKTRDIEQLNITALCPAREIPTQGRYHQDPFAYYHPGDLIRAVMKDVDEEQERLTISVQTSALPEHVAHVKLGVINAEQMPPHYRCVLAVSGDDTLTYEDALRNSVAFSNPACVEFLMSRLGISESHPPSLLRGLQSSDFSAEDFAPVLRQKQSTAWALKCVKSGVDHFKSGQPVEAMNAYNRALEMDPTNVEALVARGALFASKGSLTKATEDLEAALEASPTHRNARKYLGQTLWQRGQQVFAEGQLLSAESLYQRALELVPELGPAHDGLRAVRAKLQEREAEVKLEEKKRQQKEDVAREATSADKLRQLLHDEKRTQKKRRRSPSESSSVITVSSTDSSESSHSSSGGGGGGPRKHKRSGKKRAKKKPSKSKARGRGKGKKRKKSGHRKKRKSSSSKPKRKRRHSDSSGERRSHAKRHRPSSSSRRRTESESRRSRKESVTERSAGRAPRSISHHSSSSSSSTFSSRSRTRSGSERSTNGRPSYAKNNAGKKRPSLGSGSCRSFSPGPDRRCSPVEQGSVRRGDDSYDRSYARSTMGEGRSPSLGRSGRNKSPCVERKEPAGPDAVGAGGSRSPRRPREWYRHDYHGAGDACSPPPCTSGSFLRDGRAGRAPSVVVVSDSSDNSPSGSRGPGPRREQPGHGRGGSSRGCGVGGHASTDRSGLGQLSVSYDSQQEEEVEYADEDDLWRRHDASGPRASRNEDGKTQRRHESERLAGSGRRQGHGVEPREGRCAGGGDAHYWERGRNRSFEGPERASHRSSSSLASDVVEATAFGAEQGAPRTGERMGNWKGEESRRQRTVSGSGGGGGGGGRLRSISGGAGVGDRGGDGGGVEGSAAWEQGGEKSGEGRSGKLLNSQPDRDLPQQLQDILGKIERFKRDKKKETTA